jgi:aspartyl-tRNA synthetase
MGAKGLVWIKVGDDLALDSPVAKFLSDTERAALLQQMQAKSGDLLLLVADEWSTSCEVLGHLRNEIRYLLVSTQQPGSLNQDTTRFVNHTQTTSSVLRQTQ